MEILRIAAFLSFIFLPACEGPALFVTPLEPAQDDALVKKFLGAWSYVGSDTSDDWESVVKTYIVEGEVTEDVVEPKHWHEAIGLLVVPETSNTVSAVLHYSYVEQTQLPDGNENAWGRTENGWLALSIHGTEVEDEIFVSAKAEGGWMPSHGFLSAQRLGPHDQFYMARVKLLDENHLEIAPIWEHVVQAYLRPGGADSENGDIQESQVTFRCGWDCGVTAYDLSKEQLSEMIAQFSEEISQTAVVFKRAPEVKDSVFHLELEPPDEIEADTGTE